jgi:hypothetical protein
MFNHSIFLSLAIYRQYRKKLPHNMKASNEFGDVVIKHLNMSIEY